jgi:hypothetical protein
MPGRTSGRFGHGSGPDAADSGARVIGGPHRLKLDAGRLVGRSGQAMNGADAGERVQDAPKTPQGNGEDVDMGDR